MYPVCLYIGQRKYALDSLQKAAWNILSYTVETVTLTNISKELAWNYIILLHKKYCSILGMRVISKHNINRFILW